MKFLVAVLFLSSFFSIGANAGDMANGKKIFKKVNCAQCHKKDGMGKAKMKAGKLKISATKGPRITGLSEAYIVAQVTAIQGKDKATRRKTKATASMKAKIKKLSSTDIADLATFISKHLKPAAGTHKGMLE